MPRFAATTTVPVEKSRAEIESVLTKYGATHFGYSTEPGRATIMFICRERKIRFSVALPLITDKEFLYTEHRRHRRTGTEQHKVWEQACRQRWRALLLSIKAKLEAVEAKISEFEEEFLPFIVNPENGQTVYESLRDQVSQAYLGQQQGPLLLTGPKA
jgi:hypothetical protein